MGKIGKGGSQIGLAEETEGAVEELSVSGPEVGVSGSEEEEVEGESHGICGRMGCWQDWAADHNDFVLHVCWRSALFAEREGGWV